MGKGDKKSKRGKIFMGSYGVSRPARKKVTETSVVDAKDTKVKKIVDAEPVKEVKKEKKEPKVKTAVIVDEQKETKKESKKETKKEAKKE